MSTPSAKDTMLKQDMGRVTTQFADVLAETREKLANVIGAMPRDAEADGVAARARTVEQMLAPLEEEARELGALWSRVALAQWRERSAARDGDAIQLLEDAGWQQRDGGWYHESIAQEEVFKSKWSAVTRITEGWEPYPDIEERARELLRERRDEELGG